MKVSFAYKLKNTAHPNGFFKAKFRPAPITIENCVATVEGQGLALHYDNQSLETLA